MFIDDQKMSDFNPWFRNACFIGYSEGYDPLWWV